MTKDILIRVLYFCLGLAWGFSMGCGDGLNEEPLPPLPTVGQACAVDEDCVEGETCYLRLEGVDLNGDAVEFVFHGGMCSSECEDLGAWQNGYDICLVWPPSGDQMLINSCRNDLDCRWEEGYDCSFIGFEGSQGLNACSPVQEIYGDES